MSIQWEAIEAMPTRQVSADGRFVVEQFGRSLPDFILTDLASNVPPNRRRFASTRGAKDFAADLIEKGELL